MRLHTAHAAYTQIIKANPEQARKRQTTKRAATPFSEGVILSRDFGLPIGSYLVCWGSAVYQ